MQPLVAIEPAVTQTPPGKDSTRFVALRRLLADAVAAAGGTVVGLPEASGLIWLGPGTADRLGAVLAANPAISWVQLPWAGIDSFNGSDIFTRPVTFTCAKGSFADQVAEHALLLTLSCLRSVVAQARTPSWRSIEPRSLFGKRVTVLGAGGIAASLVRLLAPFGCHVRALRRHATVSLVGADETLPVADLAAVLPDTDVLVLALALTSQTRHVVGAPELALLPSRAVVVNVARGGVVDTDALVAALASGGIAAAGLDVTDPEPLPAGHPLWSSDNVLVTSHCADSAAYVATQLAERVRENVGRLARSEPLLGVVDPVGGY